MTENQHLKDRRIADPLFDRRSGDDNRNAYKFGHHAQGGIERRKGRERVRAYHDRGHSADEIRINNIGQNPFDRQFGRGMGGWCTVIISNEK